MNEECCTGSILHRFIGAYDMTYRQTIEYLFNSTPVFENVGATAYKEGFTNTHLLDRHFNHPHSRYKTIHVAGTNGKGSCSHTLAAILQSAGYRVGLYTSPHLVDFRERIRINGNCISEQYVVDFVEQERAFFEPLHPSFFELTTALAFKYFADEQVDIAVIEVGFGGRLDCTNIIHPLLSVITNISLDHTQFLGDTLEKIASEKAGIIKRDTPIIIGEYLPDTKPVFQAKAQEMNAPLSFAEGEKEVLAAHPNADGGITYQTKNFGKVDAELAGDYQRKNTNTVLCAVRELQKMRVIRDTDCVKQGFRHVVEYTGFQGRWQKIRSTPTVICDTGHNVGGWEYLSRQLQDVSCLGVKRIVFGMVDDKDIDGVMRMLPHDAVYYFTKASSHRAISEYKVGEKGMTYGLKGRCFPSVSEAYRQALADAVPTDFIFVGGSSYIVSDFLSGLKE